MLTTRNVGNKFSLSEELIGGNNNFSGKELLLTAKEIEKKLNGKIIIKFN